MLLRKTGIVKLLLLTVLLTMVLGGARQAFAKHTAVGKAASVTYVKPADPRRVIIYVGDSRVMYCTCGGGQANDIRTNFAFCFVNGGNISVIRRSGGKLTPFVEEFINRYRSLKPVVVLNFGLNGNGKPAKNARKLINVYQAWMNAYPDLTFYVEGVGSTIVKKGPYSNANVIMLNNLLRAHFEPKGMWIDTYQYLEQNDIVNSTKKGRRDKYHYKWVTSRQILARLRELIK